MSEHTPYCKGIDFSTCHYNPTGQIFLVEQPGYGELRILDLRGFGYFGDVETQHEVAVEIAKRIRFYGSLVEDYQQLQAERDMYREAINQFVKADTGLREDYRDYCDDNGEAPDWVFEHEEFFHKLWDKAIARLHEIVGEEALKEADDEI